MDLMQLQRPAWWLIAIGGTWVYAVIALIATGRASDARLVVAFPICAGTAVGAYAGVELLQVVSLAGDTVGPATRAAGVAEALIPVVHASVAGAILSCFVQFSGRLAGVRRRRSQAGSLALVIAAFVFSAWIVVMLVCIDISVAAAAQLKYIGLLLCAVATLLAAAMLFLAVHNVTAREDEKYSRWLFMASALVFAIVAVGLLVTEHRLRAFAAGGGA